jgi:hypothetical protein
MDANTAAIYIHELNNQCNFVEASLKLFNQALEQRAPVAVFYAGQSFLTYTSHIARILWPVRVKAVRSAEELRGLLAVGEDHPLNDKKLLHVWDHPEERLEDWIAKTRGRYVIMDQIGPFGVAGGKPLESLKEGDIFRQYDPATNLLYYRGDVFDLQRIASGAADIAARTRRLHQQFFPAPPKKDEPATAASPADAPASAG